MELDRNIGGFPLPSLNLIEGENDSGKSVIVQQICWGVIRAGLSLTYITTENSVRSLLSQMASLSLNVDNPFANGQFKIVCLHTKGIKWNKKISKYYLVALLNFIRKRVKSNVIIIDSFTYVVTYVVAEDILEFFSAIRNVVDMDGKSLFITIHPYALPSELLTRVRSICDGHFELKIKELMDKSVRIFKVSKLKGATKVTGNLVSFEVDPVFGVKVMPFGEARA